MRAAHGQRKRCPIAEKRKKIMKKVSTYIWKHKFAYLMAFLSLVISVALDRSRSSLPFSWEFCW